MQITRHARAKINLSLHVTGRRGDGYHLLDSVIVFTRWSDDIVFEPSRTGGLSLLVAGDQGRTLFGDLLTAERGAPNLVVRAAYAMADAAQRPLNGTITLHKNIPIGAGLGGGSADAAAVMHLLNDLWDRPLSMDELCAIGLTLGAELPVCLREQATRVQGVGDILTPITDIPPFFMVIAWPDQSLLTADVFAAYRKMGTNFDAALSNAAVSDATQAHNSLTAAAISLCPAIQQILDMMTRQNGCTLARMSGSGSACFGIFDTMDQAEKAAGQFKNAVVTQTGA